MFSPQFIVWLLPVAVVSRVGWTPVLAVEATNAAVWLLYGPWMAHHQDAAFSGFLVAAQAMSVVRAAAVAWLVVAALWHDRFVQRAVPSGAASAGSEQAEQHHRETDDRGDQT